MRERERKFEWERRERENQVTERERKFEREKRERGFENEG